MKGHILLIEDDPALQQLLEDVLAEEGYSITAANTTPDIARVLDCGHPDMIITDYRLRQANGEDVCRKARQHGTPSELPIIMFSAWPQASAVVKKDLFNVFIPKPFDLWEFVGCINELLRLRSSAEAVC